MGTIIGFAGDFKTDGTMQAIGGCIFLYGFIYNEYKKGQGESKS